MHYGLYEGIIFIHNFSQFAFTFLLTFHSLSLTFTRSELVFFRRRKKDILKKNSKFRHTPSAKSELVNSDCFATVLSLAIDDDDDDDEDGDDNINNDGNGDGDGGDQPTTVK